MNLTRSEEMGRHRTWIAAVAALVLLVAAWRFLGSGPPTTEAAKTPAKTSRDKKAKPHFQSRSARYAPLPAENDPSQPDQDTVELVYPEGVLLSCPAPDLADGEYRVVGSPLRHLRAENGQLVGVLTKPSEGSGYAVTLRGDHVAEIQWTEESCRVAPLSLLTLPGVVVDEDGEPVADIDVVGCAGELLTTQEDGSFQMKILSGQACWPFAYRSDDDGFAKGAPTTPVIGGETEQVELDVPGVANSAAQQRNLLQAGAHQLMALLERHYASPSPVAVALEQHPDNPVLRAWSDVEVKELNLRYDEVEYLLSGDANEEDWQEIWLFGFGI
jgi:hypothetical protein